MAARGQQPTVITAYDNFEQMEHVKEQRVDNQSSFHSVATGQLIQGIEMPEGGLLQSMLNPTTNLQLEDIFLSPGNQRDAIEVEVRFTPVYMRLTRSSSYKDIDFPLFRIRINWSCVF